MRFLVPLLLVTALLLALDVYVWRNWRRFARPRPRLRWTVSAYAVVMAFMAVWLLAYFALSDWWEVEPRALRRAAIGVWAVWYVPKLPIALVLLLKDFGRFATWLFGWFRARLRDDAPEARGASPETPVPARPDLADRRRMPRREFLQKAGWSAAAAPFVVVGYGVFRGLYDFQIRRVTVPIPGLPRALEGVRIAQLSDLHAGSLFSKRPMEDAVDLLLAERPDLVAITGDFVNNDHREAPTILPALDRLAAPLGVYGVRGNHDHYADIRRVSELIDATAVDLLVNDARTLRVDGARLHIVGTDNTGFGQNHADLPRALARTDPNGDDAFVLLAHDPTFWDRQVREAAPQIGLTLSGHTHGGQIGIEAGPLRWGLARAVYPRWAGLYAEPGPEGPQHLYVNRGLGTVGPPVRLGIRPEITILTLTRA